MSIARLRATVSTQGATVRQSSQLARVGQIEMNAFLDGLLRAAVVAADRPRDTVHAVAIALVEDV